MYTLHIIPCLMKEMVILYILLTRIINENTNELCNASDMIMRNKLLQCGDIICSQYYAIVLLFSIQIVHKCAVLFFNTY